MGAIAAVFLGIMGLVGSVVSRAECLSRWEGYAGGVSWGPLAGCRVEVTPGRWVPTSAIRDLDVRP